MITRIFTYQPVVKDFTGAWILETYFDGKIVAETTSRFIEVQQDTEWGVDLVLLEEIAGKKGEDIQVAYRHSNPMVDEDWQLGTLENVAEALNSLSKDWRDFIEPEVD